MCSGCVVLPERAIEWELRGAWAARKTVVLVLSERCEVRRIQGEIERVSPTGAYVMIDGWHVPTGDILSVLTPHFSQGA